MHEHLRQLCQLLKPLEAERLRRHLARVRCSRRRDDRAELHAALGRVSNGDSNRSNSNSNCGYSNNKG